MAEPLRLWPHLKGPSFLFVCEIGSVTPGQIDGTEGAAYPFWSPDSHSVAFFAEGRLRKVDVSGGPPVDVCAARGIFRGTWNSNGVIVFSEGQELHRISAAGGESSTGTKLGPYELLFPIGAGGMGEVWKARDTRLGRIVAIKKVKEQHSERFKQEARTLGGDPVGGKSFFEQGLLFHLSATFGGRR
jgi:hypothetical protein